jgi:uncharacterized protein (TIGR02466 family)
MRSNYREIWPTPIAEYWLEDISIHEELENHIDQKYKSYQGDDSMHLFSQDTRFSLWVKECVKHYTHQFNYPTETVEIPRAWCTTQHYLHDNYIHSHNTFDLACVYYVDVNDKHPPLEIIDPREPHKFNRVRRMMADGNIASGFTSMQIPPEKYKLLIHPAYLRHGVGANLCQEPRIAVAMNIKIKAIPGYQPPVVVQY